MAEATEGQLVLVTGASGYIANHIIKQLQEEGYRVRGTLRSLQEEDKVKRLNELCPDAAHKLELIEADLTKPDSWEPAVKDVEYVIHVASPFPHQQPKDEKELIQTAVDGTQAILKACMAAKSIKRVVMTSSSVAVGYGAGHDPNKVFNEEDWTDPEKLDAYGKSKTMAEKAAWDYVKELPDEDKIELAVINPGYVMGPAVNGTQCSSMEVIKRLLERSMPFVPKLNFAIVDVRDVATAHIKAMTLPEASGKRHLLVNTNMWMRDIAQTLAKVFKQQGYNVPTTNCPNPMLYIAGLFDKGVKMIIPQCGKVHKFDNSRMKTVLGIEPKDAKDTLIDMAYSLIEAGYIKKSKKYKGPHAAAEEAQEQEKKEAGKKEGEESEEKPKENGDVKEGEGDDVKKENDGETDDKAEIKKEEEEKKSEEKKEEKSEDKSEDKKDEKTEETSAEK